MTSDQITREQLLRLLNGASRMSFDEAVAEFPLKFINTKAPHVSYTSWHIIEHLRLTQDDILNYIKNPHYVEPKWPEDYWPAQDAKASKLIWEKSIAGFKAGLQTFCDFVNDKRSDLFAIIPHAEVSLFQELLLLADHNAYHIGEFAVLRQVMQTWPKKRKE